jgi:hypothetical protein
MEYGARVIKINTSLMKKVESLQHKVLTKIAHTYSTAKQSALRVLFGTPPMEARYNYLLLSCFYAQMQGREGKLSAELLRREYEFTRNNMDKVIITRRNESEPTALNFCGEVWVTLKKYELLNFWDVTALPQSTMAWKNTLRSCIFKKHYQKDIEDLQNNESMYICYEVVRALLHSLEISTSSKHIYPPIYKKFLTIKGEKEKEEECDIDIDIDIDCRTRKRLTTKNGNLVKFIISNFDLCWTHKIGGYKQLNTKTCPWCKQAMETTKHSSITCTVTDTTKEQL